MSTPYLRVTALRPPQAEDDGTVSRWEIVRMEPRNHPWGDANRGYGMPEDTDDRVWVGGTLLETWDDVIGYLADERAWALEYGSVEYLAWAYGCTEDRVRRALRLPDPANQ